VSSSGSIDWSAALSAVEPSVAKIFASLEAKFMAAFGGVVAAEHQARLQQVYRQAATAKTQALFARTAADAQLCQEIFEASCRSLDTIGLDEKIVDKSIARAFLKSGLQLFGEVVPVVVGEVIRIARPIALPGIGSLAGPLAGSGAEWLLQQFFGVPGSPLA
jgi:hypothetical protein